MQLISPTSVFVTTILCIVSSAPSKKPASKGDICLNKCDSTNFQCSNDCKFPISKNRKLLFDCVRDCKMIKQACVLECADEGAFEEPLLQQHDFQFPIHYLQLAGEVDLEAMFPFL
ncbi:uncharacterized protein LOC128185855 [Crassostrea angulata]|uniref:uncharacterized protein LOC128185855 n=1 Tax=Magallana angulata TaxID=2784310 RepID=UPI0022B13B40|nr:uncharacterized protein LOC128185855 [Crassostrea angulata]